MNGLPYKFFFYSTDLDDMVDKVRRVRRLSGHEIRKIKSRFKIIDGIFNCYMFKDFVDYRYLFITEGKLNFAAMEAHYGQSEIAYNVYGALFDLKTLNFVRFPGVNSAKREVFYRFIIYDVGVPHIVYNEDRKNYSIMYLGQNGYQHIDYRFIEYDFLPVVIKYVDFNQALNGFQPVRKRALFYNIANNYRLLILDGLHYVTKIKGVTFCDCLYSNALADEINRAFFREGLKESRGHDKFVSETNYYVKPQKMQTYTIGNDSVVVLEYPKAEFGDKIFLLMNGGIVCKKDFSFFDYAYHTSFAGKTRGHLLVECWCAENDYDNGRYIFDATANTIGPRQ